MLVPSTALMLTAWGFASAFGSLLIAHMRETTGSYRGALHVIAGVVAVSTLLPILVRPPRTRGLGAGEAEYSLTQKREVQAAHGW